MRPVTLGNGPAPAAGNAFDQWVASALQELERASKDTLQNDTSSSGNALATVHGAAADEIVYFTSETATAFTTLSSFGRQIIALADGSAALTLFGAVPATRTISAGTGLTGGGDLSADRTLSLADMAQATIKGRASGAGTGAPQDLTGAQVRTITGAAATTQTMFVGGLIKAAANQDYRIIEKIPFGATLTSFTGKLASGTLTATLKINTTAVTSGALNVTSTQGTATPSAANVMVSGDALVITVSAVSNPVDFSFTVVYSYTLS